MFPRTSFDSDMTGIDVEEPEDELASHAMHVVSDNDEDEEEGDEEDVSEVKEEGDEEAEEKIKDGLAELEEMEKHLIEEEPPIQLNYDE